MYLPVLSTLLKKHKIIISDNNLEKCITKTSEKVGLPNEYVLLSLIKEFSRNLFLIYEGYYKDSDEWKELSSTTLRFLKKNDVIPSCEIGRGGESVVLECIGDKALIIPMNNEEKGQLLVYKAQKDGILPKNVCIQIFKRLVYNGFMIDGVRESNYKHILYVTELVDMDLFYFCKLNKSSYVAKNRALSIEILSKCKPMFGKLVNAGLAHMDMSLDNVGVIVKDDSYELIILDLASIERLNGEDINFHLYPIFYGLIDVFELAVFEESDEPFRPIKKWLCEPFYF